MEEFFKERGIDVHDYVIDVKSLEHQAYHAKHADETIFVRVMEGGQEVAKKVKAGWWEEVVLSRIAEREATLGRKLKKMEMEQIATDILRFFKITGPDAKWHRYSKA